MTRLTIKGLHDRIGIAPTTPGYGLVFGDRSKAALLAMFTNKQAEPISDADYVIAAKRLGVPVQYIKGVHKVETPKGAYDASGRPTAIYERHKFRNNCIPVGRFNASHPLLSGPAYGPGGYGKLSAQYTKLLDACALDPEAAFCACSWGAFQVLGENATALGYASAFDMAFSLVQSEGAHLATFVAYIEANHLVDELQACRPNDPKSCIPLARGYNGEGYAAFNYHRKIAAAIA